jgi:hypothetical protein
MLTDYKKPVPFVALSIFTFFLFVYLCYKELNKWRAAANGVTGEDTFRDTLSGIVDNDSVVFHSVPTYWGDIDYLLVSPGGVYAFEIKHHSGHICYDRAGWTRTKISGGGVAYTGGIGNPSGQLTRNILWLKDYLNSEGIDSVWINGIVVFTHPSASLSIKGLKHVMAIRPHELEVSLKGCEIGTEKADQIRKAIEKLREA